jgi:hypothetical protein
MAGVTQAGPGSMIAGSKTSVLFARILAVISGNPYFRHSVKTDWFGVRVFILIEIFLPFVLKCGILYHKTHRISILKKELQKYHDGINAYFDRRKHCFCGPNDNTGKRRSGFHGCHGGHDCRQPVTGY